MASNIKTLALPLIVTGVFTLSCLMPVIQFVMMTFDGGMLSIVNELLFENTPMKVDVINWIVNFSLSVLFLGFFFRSSSMAGKLAFSILAFFFLFCFFVFLTADKYEFIEPYFVYFMLVSLVSGLILCATAMVKSRVQYA